MTPLILFLPLFALFPPQDCFCSPRMSAWLAGLVLPSCASQISLLVAGAKHLNLIYKHWDTEEKNINSPPPVFQCPVWKLEYGFTLSILSFNKMFQTTAVPRLLSVHSSRGAQDKGADAVQWRHQTLRSIIIQWPRPANWAAFAASVHWQVPGPLRGLVNCDGASQCVYSQCVHSN